MPKALQGQSEMRFLDQEPDTVAIIPLQPQYVVLGTYSLVEGESKADNTSHTAERRGSLQILPFSDSSDQITHGSVYVARKDFPFGIYDLHFHPIYCDILGVATSNAELLFFRVNSQTEHIGAGMPEIIEIGRLLVEEPHEDDGRRAIITQFVFIDFDHASLDDNGNRYQKKYSAPELLLLATTQFGNTKLIKVLIPNTSLPPTSNAFLDLDCQIVTIHKQSFDLEAWTVLPILHNSGSSQDLLVVSGGDDSQLMVSSLAMPASSASAWRSKLGELDLDTLTPIKLVTDTRTHEAGIVSLELLDDFPYGDSLISAPADARGYLILTGSYDEHIRLFRLSPPTSAISRWSCRLLDEYRLPGSVWRIQLLDSYCHSTPTSAVSKDYVLLIAGHTAGAFVVRLSSMRAATTDVEQLKFAWTIERSFTEHESLVYVALGKKRDKASTSDPGSMAWDMISASFYDKRMCQWEWIDEKR